MALKEETLSGYQMVTDPNLLHARVVAAARKYGSKAAIEARGQSITYADMLALALRIGATLQRFAPSEPSLTAIYGGKSISTYASLLGILLRGSGYVPLSLGFPAPYNRELIERSGVTSVVIDKEGEASLGSLLEDLQRPLTVLCLDAAAPRDLRTLFPQHIFLGESDLSAYETLRPSAVTPADLAYILFTSGSTGRPKGVPVTHNNILPLVESLIERHGITTEDRIAQVNDLTFDLSVAEMFTTWFSGATLCPLSRGLLLNLTTFLRDSRVTVMHTAPSIGLAAHKMGRLTPNCLPDMRVSVFAGEVLPVVFANAWSEAAPNSLVDNLYGPTEAAVYVTGYIWKRDTPAEDVENGAVPIGYPLPGVKIRVVDDDLNEISAGKKGELLLGGRQVASGYLADPEKSSISFIRPPGCEETYYRTGDIVRRPENARPLIFYGRKDDQIKILGIRVELGQIEAALRDATGVMEVAALGWPPLETGYGGVVAFIGTDACDLPIVKKRLSQLLNRALIPKAIYLLKDLPLTTSGKIDRNGLRVLLEAKRSE